VRGRGADGAASLPGARTSWSEPPLAGPATTASWIREPLSLSRLHEAVGWVQFASRHGNKKKDPGKGSRRGYGGSLGYGIIFHTQGME
jgi:hypothetical protein